ncbi:MFS transporter [Nocardiopsis suaedae]|uniref:MFS transporter n=1 Tax=Nocardiopsis suaedae TaxID=3018444 RepID=A0ABT4TM40_9ACTN|nr:MFS transporter [Nocardiopsis suaedae]MDA2805769.1 MFS transporter [Nocardiopsis suaedae]
MAGAIISPVVEVIRGGLGVSGTAAGLVITGHALGIALASPLIGRAIDRWGARRVLAAGPALFGAAGGAGMATGDSYAALLVTRLVFGVGAAAVFSGTTVGLLALYQGAARDRAMGWRGTASSLGGVVWPLPGGALGGLSWHAPFAIYLLGIPLGLAVLYVLPDDARGARERAGAQRTGAFALLARHPVLLAHYGLLASSAVLLYVMMVFLPQRLAQIGVEAPLAVSLYSVSMTVAMSVVGLACARVRARSGYVRMLRLAVASWAAAFVLMALVDVPAALVAALVLLGFGQGVVSPAVTVMIGEAVPEGLRGQATALSGTAVFAGQFASPLMLGPVVEAASVQTGFLVSAGFAALVLAALAATRFGAGADAAARR